MNISVVPTEKLFGQPYHPYRAGQTLEIDLPEVGEKEHIIEIDQGQTALTTVVDETGKPASGLVVAGITQTNQDGVDQTRVFKLPASESKFTVFGLGEKEKRRVVVIQPDKKLASSLLLNADTKETLTIAPLQPLRGTFTDVEGHPLVGLTVAIDYEGDFGLGNLFREHASKWVMTAMTDKDGKFEIPDLIPGLPFTFAVNKGKTQFRGAPRLGTRTVPVGQPLDIGVRKLEEILD